MGLRINTNVASVNAQRSLRLTRQAIEKNLERLSSGSRINRAGDDAAGLAISEGFKAQIRGMKQAERNSQDGISLVQVAEGGLTEISSICLRLRELAVQAASDTIGANERKFLNLEYDALLSEVDRISNSTEFNRVSLLNGSGGQIDVQVGTGNNPSIDRITFDASSTNVGTTALGLNLTNVLDKNSAQGALNFIDKAIQGVSAIRADFGAIQNRLQSTVNNDAISIENISAANSRIRDADIAEESAEFTKQNILSQAGTAVLSQANNSGAGALQLLQSMSR